MKNRNVVYTCLVGRYDKLREPYVVNGWDYICFSNDYIAPEESVWKVRRIPFNCSDKTLLSRFVKLLPHEVLQEYKYSLYMDANLSIAKKEFYNYVDEKISTDELIALAKHPQRSCIYKEASACLRLGKESFKKIKRQLIFLKTESFPNEMGLHENNIILRQHNDPRIIKMDQNWMDVYIKYSKRDQLSLEYVAWKHAIKIAQLFYNGFDPRFCEIISYSVHERSKIKKLLIELKKISNKTYLLLDRKLQKLTAD